MKFCTLDPILYYCPLERSCEEKPTYDWLKHITHIKSAATSTPAQTHRGLTVNKNLKSDKAKIMLRKIFRALALLHSLLQISHCLK